MKTTWDISYELEGICEKVFNADFAHTNTLFDRNIIEKDMFFDVMVLLLHIDNKDGEKSQNFIDKFLKYKRMPMKEIEDYESIFSEFKTLIKY